MFCLHRAKTGIGRHYQLFIIYRLIARHHSITSKSSFSKLLPPFHIFEDSLVPNRTIFVVADDTSHAEDSLPFMVSPRAACAIESLKMMNPGRQIVYLLLGDGDGSVRALLDDKFARIVDRTDGVLFAALIDIGQMFEKGRLVNDLKTPLMIL